MYCEPHNSAGWRQFLAQVVQRAGCQATDAPFEEAAAAVAARHAVVLPARLVPAHLHTQLGRDIGTSSRDLNSTYLARHIGLPLVRREQLQRKLVKIAKTKN